MNFIMRNYIENDGKKTTFIIESDNGAVLDTVSLGMLENNNIAGMLPFTVMHVDDVTTVRYDVTPYVTLTEMLERTVSRKEILSVVSTVLEASAMCEDYMMEADSIILDPDRMFYDEKSSELHLCIMPFITDEEKAFPVRAFLKDFICRAKFDSSENCDYIGKILGILNSGEDPDINVIRNMFSEQENKAEEPLPDNSETVSVSSENTTINENVFCAPDPEPVKQTVSEPVSMLDSFADDDDETEEESSLKGFFSGILGRKTKAEKSDKKQDVFSDDDALMAGFSDGKDGYFIREKDVKGTVILKNGEENRTPVLVRTSNDEKIEIKGKRFRIGSDKKSVNYCISDNCAVSRMHADIINKKGVLYIVDNNSTNHTYLDDQLLKGKKEYRLKNDSLITLADEEFRVCL